MFKYHKKIKFSMSQNFELEFELHFELTSHSFSQSVFIKNDTALRHKETCCKPEADNANKTVSVSI